MKGGSQGVPRPFQVHDDAVRPGTNVIRVAGELDLSTTARFNEVVERVVRERPESVVVDMAECDFLDSAGLKALASLADHLGGQSRFALAGAGAQIDRLIAVTGFAGSIRLEPSVTVDAAVAESPAA